MEPTEEDRLGQRFRATLMGVLVVPFVVLSQHAFDGLAVANVMESAGCPVVVMPPPVEDVILYFKICPKKSQLDVLSKTAIKKKHTKHYKMLMPFSHRFCLAKYSQMMNSVPMDEIKKTAESYRKSTKPEPLSFLKLPSTPNEGWASKKDGKVFDWLWWSNRKPEKHGLELNIKVPNNPPPDADCATVCFVFNDEEWGTNNSDFAESHLAVITPIKAILDTELEERKTAFNKWNKKWRPMRWVNKKSRPERVQGFVYKAVPGVRASTSDPTKVELRKYSEMNVIVIFCVDRSLTDEDRSDVGKLLSVAANEHFGRMSVVLPTKPENKKLQETIITEFNKFVTKQTGSSGTVELDFYNGTSSWSPGVAPTFDSVDGGDDDDDDDDENVEAAKKEKDGEKAEKEKEEEENKSVDDSTDTPVENPALRTPQYVMQQLGLARGGQQYVKSEVGLQADHPTIGYVPSQNTQVVGQGLFYQQPATQQVQPVPAQPQTDKVITATQTTAVQAQPPAQHVTTNTQAADPVLKPEKKRKKHRDSGSKKKHRKRHDKKSRYRSRSRKKSKRERKRDRRRRRARRKRKELATRQNSFGYGHYGNVF